MAHLVVIDVQFFVEDLVRKWDAGLGFGVDFVHKVLFDLFVGWLVEIVALALQQVLIKLLVPLVHVIRGVQIFILFNHADFLTRQSQIDFLRVLVLQLFEFCQTFLVELRLFLCSLIYIAISLGDDLRINTLPVVLLMEASFFVWGFGALIIRWDTACELSDFQGIELVLEVLDRLFLTILQSS